MAESTGPAGSEPEGAGLPGIEPEGTGLGGPEPERPAPAGIEPEGTGLDGRERDLAPIGALVGHPARAAMLAALAGGRALARPCLDWTQRRPHLAGAMPAAITARLIDLRLLARTAGRGLRPAPDYQARIDSWLRPL